MVPYLPLSHPFKALLRTGSKINVKLKRLIHDIEFPGKGKRTEYAAITRYNAYVFSVHNYYKMATKVCSDLKPMAFSVHKSLKARLRKRIKTAKQVRKRKLKHDIPDYIKERYGLSGDVYSTV